MASTPSRDHVDPVFEFEAPKYIDFATNVENGSEDAWFDSSQQAMVAEELKTEDLLQGNSDEDFGTGASDEMDNKKRSVDMSQLENSERPIKKTRHVYSHGDSGLRLTVPHTPKFATNSRLRPVPETDEDMQSRYMASMLVEQAKRRKFNSFYKKKALYGSAGYLPTRSTKPLTEPEDVHFCTDERIRCPPQQELPKPELVVEKTETGLTIPRPFQFQLDHRVKQESTPPPKSPFMSFKQKLLEIQQKTPLRFRTLPRNRRLWKQKPKPLCKLGITVPVGFSFETADRVRPTKELSSEQREALEMEKIVPFKALPLDERILHSGGQFGITRVPKQPLTAPETPKFTTKERAAERAARKEQEPMEEEAPIPQFRARELDRSIFTGPAKGVPTLSHREVTIPESPCLATKSRSVFHPAPAVPKEEPFVFKARPIPVVEPFVPEKKEHKLEVQPFQLTTDLRGQKATEVFTQKVRKEKKKEKSVRNFKAQPMPITEQPEPRGYNFASPVTIPQPFNLQSEARGEQHTQLFQRQVEEEEAKRREQALFKANPIPDEPAFEPKRSDKPLTVITDFALNSDLRSAQRQRFEQQKTEKSKLAEEAKRLQEEERKMEEEKFIRQMRKKLVHKPMPIMPSKPIEIQRSSQPLTDPHTPLLRTRQRSAAHGGRDL